MLAVIMLVLLSFMVKVQWTKDDTIAELKVELKSTKEGLAFAKEVPTERDRDLAKTVMALWEPNGNFFIYLTTRFTAKIWQEDEVEPLYDFVSRYKNHFFDDDIVNEAFIALHKAASELEDWLSAEGAATNEYNQHPVKGQPFVYTIREIGVFLSAEKYDEMRKEGLRLARSAISASREFTVVARKQKL